MERRSVNIERLNDYQDAARKTTIGKNLDHFVLGLVEEAGEAAGVLKRFYRGDENFIAVVEGKREAFVVEGEREAFVVEGKRGAFFDLSPFAKDKLIAEVGDVLWYLAMIADLLEVRLADVATMNIAKLSDRAKRNVIQGEGDNR